MVALPFAAPLVEIESRSRLESRQITSGLLGRLTLLLCVLIPALASSVGPVLAAPATDAKDGVWTPLPPPAARSAAAAILDPLRDRLLVFGGEAVDGAKNDVWQLSLSGTPAWSLLDIAGTLPSGRYLHTAIYDPIRDRVIVFGGAAGVSETSSHETWSLSLSGTPTWTLLAPLGTPPVARTNHTAIYDPVRDRMLIYGGFRSDPNTALGDVHALSLSGSLEWVQLDVLAAPPVRGGHAAVYDPVGDRMLVFGGTEGANGLNDVWALGLGATPSWSQVSVAGTPPWQRFGAAAVYDASASRMVLFGGIVSPNFPVPLNDAWALSLSGGPTWNQLALAAPLPSARYYCGAAFDSARRRLLVFGGIAPDAPTDLVNELWALDLTPPEAWSVPPLLTPPEPRMLPCSAYDSRRQLMWVWGGGTESQLYPDVWSLALSSVPEWRKYTIAMGPSARTGASSIYDSDGDRIVVFGGNDGATRNDLWALSPEGTPQWSTIAAVGTAPPPRYGHTAVWDSAGRRTIIFGGMNDSWELMNDVWELSLLDPPTWRQLIPLGTLPSPRAIHAAVYDPNGNRMLVFGGYGESESGGETSLGDLWQLSLSESPEWTLLPAAEAAPTARRGATAIRDAVRDRMVLHGGYLGSGLYTDETWEFSLASNQWRLLAPAGIPPSPARGWHTAIYDSPRDRMVVFGGFNDDVAVDMPLNDTWVLDWSDAATPVLISLVEASAGQGSVRLRWYTAGTPGLRATVYRREGVGAWTPLAVIAPNGSGFLDYVDAAVFPGTRYGYRLGIIDGGREVFAGEVWTTTAERPDFVLEGVRPNPTQGRQLTVHFILPSSASARLRLLDVGGRRVVEREVGSLGPGRHAVDLSLVRRLVPGVYFVHLTQGGDLRTARVAVLD